MTYSAATCPIRSINDLMAVRERTPLLRGAAPDSANVLVGMNNGKIASGAKETAAAFREAISRAGVNARVFQTGCVGMCFDEPLVDVVLPGRPLVPYKNVVADQVARVVDEHLQGGGGGVLCALPVGRRRPAVGRPAAPRWHALYG